MSAMRFDPMRGFEKFSRKMNDLMEEVNKGVSIETGGFNPRVDIIEDDKFVYVNAEMAGISKEDVKISVNDENVLTIKGEKKRSEKQENLMFHRTERYFGNFSRSFFLPDNLNKDNITAKFENGILTLIVPKVEPAQPKEVEINIQ